MSKCKTCGELATWKTIQAEVKQKPGDTTPTYKIIREEYYCKTHKPKNSQPIEQRTEQPTLLGYIELEKPLVKTLTGEVRAEDELKLEHRGNSKEGK